MFKHKSQNRNKSIIQKEYKALSAVQYRQQRQIIAEQIIKDILIDDLIDTRDNSFDNRLHSLLLDLSTKLNSNKNSNSSDIDDYISICNSTIKQLEQIAIRKELKEKVLKELFKRTYLGKEYIGVVNDTGDYRFILPWILYLFIVAKFDIVDSFYQLLIYYFNNDTSKICIYISVCHETIVYLNNHQSNSDQLQQQQIKFIILNSLYKTSIPTTLVHDLFIDTINSFSNSGDNVKNIVLYHCVKVLSNHKSIFDGDIEPICKSFYSSLIKNNKDDLFDSLYTLSSFSSQDEKDLFTQLGYIIKSIGSSNNNSRLISLHFESIRQQLEFNIHSQEIDQQQQQKLEQKKDKQKQQQLKHLQETENKEIQLIKREYDKENKWIELDNSFNFISYIGNQEQQQRETSNSNNRSILLCINDYLERQCQLLDKRLSMERMGIPLSTLENTISASICAPYHLCKLIVDHHMPQKFDTLIKYFNNSVLELIKQCCSNSSSNSNNHFIHHQQEIYLSFIHLCIVYSRYYNTSDDIYKIMYCYGELMISNFDTTYKTNIKLLNQFQTMVYNNPDAFNHLDILQSIQSKSLMPIQHFITKTMNQLTTLSSKDQDQDQDQQPSLSQDNNTTSSPSPIVFEDKLLSDLSLICLIAPDQLFNYIFKSIVQNKGQQSLFVDLLFDHLHKCLSSPFPQYLFNCLVDCIKSNIDTLFSLKQHFHQFNQFIVLSFKKVYSQSLCDQSFTTSFLLDFISPLLESMINNNGGNRDNDRDLGLANIVLHSLNDTLTLGSNDTAVSFTTVETVAKLYIKSFNYQFTNSLPMTSLLDLFYSVFDGLFHMLVNNDNEQVFELSYQEFNQLDWKLQFRIVYRLHYFDNLDCFTSLPRHSLLQSIMQLKSHWNTTAVSKNEKVKELSHIENLIHFSCISPAHQTVLINDIIYLSNPNIFKKLLLLTLANLLPVSPNSYYHILCPLLSLFLKSKMILLSNINSNNSFITMTSSTTNNNNNITNTMSQIDINTEYKEISEILYQLLFTFVQLNSNNGIDDDTDQQFDSDQINFLKQISNLFQELFLLQNSKIDFIFALYILLKSIYLLLKNNLDSDLYFIVLLGISGNIKTKSTTTATEIIENSDLQPNTDDGNEIYLQECRKLVMLCFRECDHYNTSGEKTILEDSGKSSNKYQSVIDKLTIISDKINN
ncbi:hypothetical protein CYY_009171 [Polysphondylium violaceum]|uniref:Uncharacterized protein n=1 Tax=Polysphondylium violaceum TaxID=133409 RepID=A0A8J4PM59_9MYCE|nr:hypothetical protein CYY_009171 [Polysphondylium violaceum]